MAFSPGDAFTVMVNSHRRNWDGSVCSDAAHWNCGAPDDFRQRNCALGAHNCFHISIFKPGRPLIVIPDPSVSALLAQHPDLLDDQFLFFHGPQFDERSGGQIDGSNVFYGIYRVSSANLQIVSSSLPPRLHVIPYPDAWAQFPIGPVKQFGTTPLVNRGYLRRVPRETLATALDSAVDAATKLPYAGSWSRDAHERLKAFQHGWPVWFETARKRMETHAFAATSRRSVGEPVESAMAAALKGLKPVSAKPDLPSGARAVEPGSQARPQPSPMTSTEAPAETLDEAIDAVPVIDVPAPTVTDIPDAIETSTASEGAVDTDDPKAPEPDRSVTATSAPPPQSVSSTPVVSTPEQDVEATHRADGPAQPRRPPPGNDVPISPLDVEAPPRARQSTDRTNRSEEDSMSVPPWASGETAVEVDSIAHEQLKSRLTDEAVRFGLERSALMAIDAFVRAGQLVLLAGPARRRAAEAYARAVSGGVLHRCHVDPGVLGLDDLWSPAGSQRLSGLAFAWRLARSTPDRISIVYLQDIEASSAPRWIEALANVAESPIRPKNLVFLAMRSDDRAIAIAQPEPDGARCVCVSVENAKHAAAAVATQIDANSRATRLIDARLSTSVDVNATLLNLAMTSESLKKHPDAPGAIRRIGLFAMASAPWLATANAMKIATELEMGQETAYAETKIRAVSAIGAATMEASDDE